MTVDAFVLAVLAGGLLAVVVFAAALAYLTINVGTWLQQRRRRRRGQSDREIATNLAPLGQHPAIAPSHSPRNGSTYEDVA